MTSRFILREEHPTPGGSGGQSEFPALARVVDAHTALAPLLDFCATDPAQIAISVGMVYAGEEEGAEDLEEIDFGPDDWFEPSAGLAVVERALAAVRSNPSGIAQAIYDPGLRVEDVISDLEAIGRALTVALQQETRFHFLQMT